MKTLKVPQFEIESKAKVGRLKGRDVTHIRLVGGLHLVTDASGTVLGSGPHRLVARKIAQRIEPDIEWTELSKSDHGPDSAVEHLLPQWYDNTMALRSHQ